MYVSNQVRQRRYLKGRRAEEENAINQQEVLDGLISKELGLDNTADYLNNVNKRIAERIKKEIAVKNAGDSSSENILSEQAKMNKEDFDVNTLTDYIKNGALSNLLDEFKKIDPKMLSKKAKIVQKDLSNNELKEVFNDEISIILSDNSIPDSKKPNMIKKIVYDILAGGDKSIIDELLKKSRYTQGIKDKDKIVKRQFGKEIVDDLLTKVENKIDENMREKMAKLRAKKKADFDKKMAELKAKKMAELRAKKNAEIEKKNIANIRDFDKNMREKMAEIRAKDKFIAKELQNEYKDMYLTAKMQEKIVDRNVNKMKLQKDLKKVILKDQMAELRAKKNPSSPTNTSIMSDAPQSLDARFGNNPNPTGRPKKPTTKSILDYETKREGKIGKKLDKGQQKRVNILWKKLNEELQNVD